MKKTITQITVRMSEKEKKQLDDLTLKNGLSINQTVLNLIEKDTETNELKTEMLAMKEQLSFLVDTSQKQIKVIVDLVQTLKQKGVV